MIAMHFNRRCLQKQQRLCPTDLACPQAPFSHPSTHASRLEPSTLPPIHRAGSRAALPHHGPQAQHPPLPPLTPQGPEQRFRITGLKPNTEYILCVKAIYDDGSFLWSESKAYMTKL